MVFVFVFILQKSLLPNNNYKYLTRKDMSTYDAKTPSMYNDDDDSEYLFTLELAIYAALPSMPPSRRTTVTTKTTKTTEPCV
jgi:hypothetical protein